MGQEHGAVLTGLHSPDRWRCDMTRKDHHVVGSEGEGDVVYERDGIPARHQARTPRVHRWRQHAKLRCLVGSDAEGRCRPSTRRRQAAGFSRRGARRDQRRIKSKSTGERRPIP